MLTREEIKELLSIMQAFAEGKIIQVRINNDSSWTDLLDDKLEISNLYEYRIKPEPKFRPFKNQEECWDEMHRHSDFGWVANKNTKSKYHINAVWDNAISLDNGEPSLHYLDVFVHYEFPDGTPFGIKE